MSANIIKTQHFHKIKYFKNFTTLTYINVEFWLQPRDERRKGKKVFLGITRRKTAIRYAKENDREKRERWRERERKVEG